MLTPIGTAKDGTPEENNNTHQMRARNIMERVNGVLKNRFRCLLAHRTLHYDPITAGKIVNVCCVLHNLCNIYNLPVPHMEENEMDDALYERLHYEEETNNQLLLEGRRLRSNIVRDFYS